MGLLVFVPAWTACCLIAEDVYYPEGVSRRGKEIVWPHYVLQVFVALGGIVMTLPIKNDSWNYF